MLRAAMERRTKTALVLRSTGSVRTPSPAKAACGQEQTSTTSPIAVGERHHRPCSDVYRQGRWYIAPSISCSRPRSGRRVTREHRRLAAIVSADVVGYSLLMGRDESATLSA